MEQHESSEEEMIATMDIGITDASELWVPCYGYEGIYEISSFGRLRSLSRTVEGRWGPTQRMGVLLALQKANGRYTKATLCRDGKCVQHQVHRLVLLSFIGQPPKSFECDHIDNDINNNRLENLRWVSKGDNLLRRNSVKLTVELVAKIRQAVATGARMHDVAERFEISERHAYAVVKGTRWKEQA